MTRIRMFDYLLQYEGLREEILAAIQRVLGSGRVILGPEVEQFEDEFAEYLQGGGACVGVNSGTDALIVALMALGIGRGDEVITVANTAVPTVSAIRSVGATPVFCDIDPSTCLMDLDDLPRRFTSRTRAVMPVHLFGNVVDVLQIRELTGRRDIKIVEDCAQAHGASVNGRLAGTMGDVGAFSFYPTKNLGAYGDAGLCYSADPDLVQDMRRIRMYGFETGCPSSQREGINSRLDEVQAAILRVKLRYLPQFSARRIALAERYDRRLPAKVERVVPGANVHHVRHLLVVKVPNRDHVQKELARRGVDTSVHYPPIHLMPGYRFLGYGQGSLPRTEAACQAVLSLPMYPELSETSVDRVCSELDHVVD